MRSAASKQGPARAPARAILRATGLDDAATARPLVAVVHTWTDVSPCNFTFRDLARYVRAGVTRGAGPTVELTIFAMSTCTALSRLSMLPSIALRATIAHSTQHTLSP